jgi:hypothetical protein
LTTVRDVIDGAQAYAPAPPDEWAGPLPFRELEGPEFPVEALPPDLGEIVDAHSEALQVPPGLSATLALNVLAAAASGKTVVRPLPDWREQVNEYSAVVLPPSERKSAAFRDWLVPLEDREQELRAAGVVEVAQKTAEADVLQRRLTQAKATASKAKDAQMAQAMAEVQRLAKEVAEFQIPTLPRLLADDATPEAVASLLADNRRIAIASAEGGLFETIAGRYSHNVPNLDVFLKGYTGDTLRVDRKSRPSEYVLHPALSLILTVQPDVMYAISGRKIFRGRGLLSRFLYQVPRPRRGYRKVDPPPMPQSLRERWLNRVKVVLRLPDGTPGQEPKLQLSPLAATMFRAFREDVELGLRPGGAYAEIEDWGGKFPGHVLRIGAALHLWEHGEIWERGGPLPWEVPVSETTMERAIRLGYHYAEHASVAYAHMRDGGRGQDARRLWDYLRAKNLDKITFRDLWRGVRRSYTGPAQLKEALGALEELGYVRVETLPSGSQGGRPSTIIHINPKALENGDKSDKTPPEQGLDAGFVTSVTTEDVTDAGQRVTKAQVQTIDGRLDQVKVLLDQLDNARRRLRHEETDEAKADIWEKEAVLTSLGADVVMPLGELWDPTRPYSQVDISGDVAEASSRPSLVAAVDRDHKPKDGEIIGVLRVGCLLGGKVVRNAEVVVFQASPPSVASDSNEDALDI